MRQHSYSFLLVGLSLLGCEGNSTRAMDAESPGRSFVHFARGEHGTEQWSSKTAIPHTSGVVEVDEAFTLDKQGTMTEGYVHIHDDKGVLDKEIWYNRGQGTVIAKEGRALERWKVESDSPWIMAPIAGPKGRPLVTPLTAWVTHRATMGHAVVRLLDLNRRRSVLVPSEQWSVATGEGAIVILGDTSAEVDNKFVTKLHDGQTELEREATSAGDWFFFHRTQLSNTASASKHEQDSGAHSGGSLRRGERVAP